MGDLNSNWVLYGSILAVSFSLFSLLAFSWKIFKGMEDSKNGKNK